MSTWTLKNAYVYVLKQQEILGVASGFRRWDRLLLTVPRALSTLPIIFVPQERQPISDDYIRLRLLHLLLQHLHTMSLDLDLNLDLAQSLNRNRNQLMRRRSAITAKDFVLLYSLSIRYIIIASSSRDFLV